jgi:myo-inositol-1(or 4)-monophosphatase
MMIMQSPNGQERFEFAQNLIIDAGDLAMQYFGNLTELSIMSKGARDMVSDADFAVEKLIKERLLAAYPDDAYLGEETGHVEGGENSGIWVVDPIDGTQPFLSGLSTWCISIAYVQANDVLLAWSTIRQQASSSSAARGERLNSMDDQSLPGTHNH